MVKIRAKTKQKEYQDRLWRDTDGFMGYNMSTEAGKHLKE